MYLPREFPIVLALPQSWSGLTFGLYKNVWLPFFLYNILRFLKSNLKLFCFNYKTPGYRIDFEFVSVYLFSESFHKLSTILITK